MFLLKLGHMHSDRPHRAYSPCADEHGRFCKTESSDFLASVVLRNSSLTLRLVELGEHCLEAVADHRSARACQCPLDYKRPLPTI